MANLLKATAAATKEIGVNGFSHLKIVFKTSPVKKIGKVLIDKISSAALRTQFAKNNIPFATLDKKQEFKIVKQVRSNGSIGKSKKAVTIDDFQVGMMFSFKQEGKRYEEKIFEVITGRNGYLKVVMIWQGKKIYRQIPIKNESITKNQK